MKEILRRKHVSTLLLLTLLTMLLLHAHVAVQAAESDYTYTVLADGTAEVTGYTGPETSLEIPETLGGYTVTSIGRYAFQGCSDLIEIRLPEGITSIGDGAFEFCRGLTELHLPE